jgi:hypothetical protein
MCRTPPTSSSAFDQATDLWPHRSRASDGTCPSHQHYRNNPTSDHNGDWRLNGYSCAYDLTHDPGSGCDAHGGIAEWLRHRASTGEERRVKYLIRHNFQRGYDEIAEPANGWTWHYAHQNQHASHLHVSLNHNMHVLLDCSPWFSATTEPQPEPTPTTPDEDDDVAYMAFPDEPLQNMPLKYRKLKGRRPTFSVAGNTMLLLTERDVKARLFLKSAAPVELPREFFEGLHIIDRADGKTN